nr:hypothetical protein CFP56_27652 [Quercus suber]
MADHLGLLAVEFTPGFHLHSSTFQIVSSRERVRASSPDKCRFTRGLIVAKEEDSSSHNNKGKIPKHVKDHHELRVGLVALALLELLRRGLSNHHRRLTQHAAVTGLVEELHGLVKALALHESAAGVGVVWANVSIRIIIGVARGGVVV